MDNYHTITPEARRNAFIALEEHPGWKLYCARQAEIVASQIDARIFDPKTTDEERRTLVEARPLLMGANAPEQVRKGMVTICETQMKQEQQKAERANATANG
jgi:hypothetical protein